MSVLERFRLDGRVAVVTGGTKGLGRAMAAGLAQAGAHVVVVSRHRDEAQDVAADLQAQTGQACRGYACDVTRPEEVDELVRQVVDRFARIDILINNAGMNIRGPIHELSLDEFQQVQTLNVTGPWLMCRAVGPHMMQQGYGRVINIGSALSIIALADRTPYATSKGALLQMTRALALEWAPHGITVNAMLPGPFATEMNKPLLDDPEAYQRFISYIPLGRWGELEEIQGLAVFLAGDAAGFITGAAITIDGGWTVH